MSKSAVSEGGGGQRTDGNNADPGSCLKRAKNIIPAIYRDEVVELFKLACPVIMSQAMVFLIGFVSTIFCGHLGKTELASVALAIAVINVTGLSIGTGLASTCDTLISQTYGSGNLKRVGVLLQRGVLILLLACFPCCAILLNTEALLLLVRQSPRVARLAQLYVNIFIPALPAVFMYQLQVRYLQNQGIIWPQVITGAIGNGLNTVANFVLLYPLDLGVAGSAAANAIAQYFLAIFIFIYIHVRGLHKKTWSGWSMECLQEWGPFVQLAIPSMLMMCLEWWTFEIGGFLAGIISEVELGSQSVVYELAVMCYMIPYGLSAAASLRVGTALGAGKVAQAKLSTKVPVTCGFILAVLVGVFMIAIRDYAGYIFTTEQEIISRVRDVMLPYGFTSIFDATTGVIGGVIRGTGKQKFGAVWNFLGYYFIGLPAGVSLMFAADLGIVGLWAGLGGCVFIQSAVFSIYLCKLNWQKTSTEAMVRAGVHVSQETEVNRVECKEVEVSAAEMVYETPSDSVQVQGQTPSPCTPVGEPMSPCTPVGEPLSPCTPVVEPLSPCTTVGELLSTSQLVLRRGLTLLLMLIILCAGIVAHFYLITLF